MVNAAALTVMVESDTAEVGDGVTVSPVVTPRTVVQSLDGVVDACTVLLDAKSVPYFALRVYTFFPTGKVTVSAKVTVFAATPSAGPATTFPFAS